MKKKIVAVILCLSILLGGMPIGNLAVMSTGAITAVSTDYGAVIGNTAVFNNYYPIPLTDAPQNVKNPWGTECEFLSEEDVPDNLVLVIKNYYCSDDGSLWYQVEAAPGFVLPEKLQNYPWVYQDDIENPMGESLIIHTGGKNFVFDKDGNVITSTEIGLYDTVQLECHSSLIGETSYQWQILVGDEWVDIADQKSQSLSVKYTLLQNATVDGRAKLRCVSQSGSKQVVGDAITFFVDTSFDYDSYVHPEAPETPEDVIQPKSMFARSARDADECYITVQFLFENGTQAANSYVAEVPYGVEYSFTLDFPYVMGYLPYYEEVQISQLTIEGTFYENEIYTVKYKPTLVDYTVDIYFQKTTSDDYDFYDTRTFQGNTGDKVPLNVQEFPGMRELLHETPTIAADGSTHFEIYYDRIYYMTRVYLDGGYGIYSVYARYGADLQSHLTAPSRPGYTFIGWDEYTVDNDADGVPETGGDRIADTVYPTVPDKNLAYVALWHENPTAQVNIVFWGENPNDEGYSYLNTQVLHVAPDTKLTYTLNSGNICGLDEHKHGNGCTVNCGIAPHEHTVDDNCYVLNCSKTSHNHTSNGCSIACKHQHTTACYTVGNYSTLQATDKPNNTLTHSGNGIYYYTNYGATHYYLNIGDNWYCAYNFRGNKSDTQRITYNCTHTHEDQCYTCGKTNETHVHAVESNCYILTCTKPLHAHEGTCYTCIEHTHSPATCEYPKFEGYDANLWTLVKSDTVTVERDGSTILNVYFDRTTFTLTFRHGNSTVATIVDKWGAKISDEFSKAPFNTTHNGYPWTCTDKSKYGFALQTLDVMPSFDATFNRNDRSTQTRKTIYYYIQNPGTNVSSSNWPTNTNNFTLLKTVDTYFNYATYAEEYHEMVGYERYSKQVSGFTSNNTDRKNFSNNTLYLYYLLASYKLEFYSGNDVVKTETMQYQQSLGGFSDYIPPLPAEYEPESHDFAGWYLNPECTGEQVVLGDTKMPAGNLALYAKWTPKFHNVRIVLQKKEDGNYTQEDSVIWNEDQQVEFLKVLHGKIVFSDNDVKTPPVPDNGLYKFLGWFYMDDDVELMWDFEHHPIVKDTVIYAKWSSEVMVPYTVYYVDQNGNQIAPPLNSSSLAGHSVTLNAKIGNELNEGYRDGYFPQIVSHSIELAIENAETGVEYTFVYEQAETKRYYVHYIDAVTGSELITTKTATTGLAIVTEKHEYVKDYVPDEYQKPLVISADETKNHIYFYYTKAENEGVWFVGHYVQDKDEPDKYNEHAPIGDIGAIGDNIQASWPVDLSKDGYVFKEATINDGTTTKTVYSIEQAKGAITAKGLEIKVYYDRIKYPYMIEYINKDTGAHIYESAVFSGEDCEPYGKTVGAVSIPTIIGYEYASSTTCTIVKDGPDNIQKNIIRVYYTEQTIRINFEVVGPEGCGTVNPPYTSVKYASDLSASATAVPSANYIFVGWFYDEDCKVPIVANSLVVPSGETLMLRKPDDGWAPVTYYAKFEPGVSDLTIRRTNAENGQVYVYQVKNDDTDEIIYVTVVGNGQVTIKGLGVGNYTITQQNGWSWRHDDQSQSISHGNDGSTVTFDNSATNDQWLNGNSENKKNQKG